jgi:hypothetical protein
MAEHSSSKCKAMSSKPHNTYTHTPPPPEIWCHKDKLCSVNSGHWVAMSAQQFSGFPSLSSHIQQGKGHFRPTKKCIYGLPAVCEAPGSIPSAHVHTGSQIVLYILLSKPAWFCRLILYVLTFCCLILLWKR